MSVEELKRFYKGMNKNPNLYSYDDDGNLIELNKEGTVIKTIALPDYRIPTFEEFDEMEKKRMESIATLNKDFEDARRELRGIYSKPDSTESEILRVNRKVKEADIKLQAVRFPLQYVSQQGGIKINKVDFDKTYEQRTYPYPFYFLEERPFTLQEQYVRIGKAPEKPLISVAEATAAAEIITPVILFEDPETNDYGFLSLKWVVEVEFNSTNYHSAQQAIYAEIAKAFNDEENLKMIMLAETPDEVQYELGDVPGDSNEAKWNDLTKQLIYDVNIAKFNQYPELAARLLETKNAVLGAYIPNDTLIGIGISLDNFQSKNPINWTGQNILGKAIMDIREKIRGEKEVVQPIQQVIQPPVVAPIVVQSEPVIPIETPVQQLEQETQPEPVTQPIIPNQPRRIRRPLVAPQ
jgi:ribA/ribD-fused uncharacterized protein